MCTHLLGVRRCGGGDIGVRLVGRRHGVHPGRVHRDEVEQVELGGPVVPVG
jgi:hypothetical protein